MPLTYLVVIGYPTKHEMPLPFLNQMVINRFSVDYKRGKE